MKNIMLIFGTRPEAIKMAPLVKEFQRHAEAFRTLVCVTGQHRQMLDQVLQLFDITPDYDLNIMQPGQDLYDVTSRVLTGMREVLVESKPDIVLVHGDTTTSTAAALAAFYQHIPVGHVEAGLRTHNVYSPWPEEMNRQLTGRIARLHFAPTETCRDNLLAEAICAENVFITGNTVIDALHWVVERLRSNAQLSTHIIARVRELGYDLARLEQGRRLVLVTGHRRENFGEGFRQICGALKRLCECFSDVDFLYPMHLNPNVRQPLQEIFPQVPHNLFLIEPLDYLPFVHVMSQSYIVLTDSGGIQEEAPSLGIPVLVMRDTTERPEAVQAGTVRLVGADMNAIVNVTSELLNNECSYDEMRRATNPYGDGRACARIIKILSNV